MFIQSWELLLAFYSKMTKSPSTPSWQPDWSNIPDESVEELLREAREHLRGTIELGINSDHRAASLCGVFGGGAFALLVAASTIFSGAHSDAPLQWAGVATAFVLFYSAYLCAQSARPADFHVGGYEPERLFSSATDLMWMRRYAIEDMQSRIQVNRAEINREARLVTRAIHIAVIAVGLGVAVYAATTLLGERLSGPIRAIRPSSEVGSGQGGVAERNPPASEYSPSCVLLRWAPSDQQRPSSQSECGLTIVVRHPATVNISQP
jgi:hypothetical protein